MKFLRFMREALAGKRPEPAGESAVLFIVLRQSPDWKNLTPEAFREQSRRFCLMHDRPAEQVNEAVDLWDATFGVSYLETRQAMKDMSLANFGQVRDSRQVSLEQVAAGETGPGLYLFTDDDDWISPGILSTLNASAHTGRRALVWGSAVFGGAGRTPIILREFDRTCYTNNYALDYSYFSGKPGRLAVVSEHLAADRNIRKRDLFEIREYLTVTNKSPASTMFLERIFRDGASRDILADEVGKYYKRLERQKTPPTLAWAEPYMRQVRAFFARVLDSRK